MSTDRPAGETAPEQEATPSPAEAPSDQDSGPAAADGSQDSGQEAGATTDGSQGADQETGGAADSSQGAGQEAGAAADGSTAAREAKAGPAASAAALAAAVRAVESGERSAASFFNSTPRPAARAAPPRDAAAPPDAPAPQVTPQRAPADTAPQHHPAAPAHEAGGPVGSPGAAAPAPESTVRPTSPGVDGVRQVLAAGGAPEALAEKAAELLGERAGEELSEDPWRLLAVPGVRPEQADAFARALLGPDCGPGDERRAQALVVWLLEQAAVAGHSALEAPALRAALAQRAVPDPDEALQTALADGAVLVFQDAIDTPGRARPAADDEEEETPVRVLLGLDRFAMAEESVADGLARLLNTFDAEDGPDTVAGGGEEDAESAADGDEAGAGSAADGAPQDGGSEEPDAEEGREENRPADAPQPDAEATPERPEDAAAHRVRPSAADWEGAAAAAPSPSAAELIRAAARSGLVAHTGAEAARAEPAALVAAARALGLRAYGATHSANGRERLAAQLAENTAHPAADGAGAPGAAAVTVAGLLSGQEGPGRDAEGALALDLLVVLDAPQLDLETAAMLIESLTDGSRLVLSGDPGVLWSAGPGRLFADLIAARCCPQVASRTPDFGPIGELVSGIGIGELSQVDAPGKEVVIVPVRDAPEAVHRTVQLVADSVPRALGVPPEQTQVITVGHGGSAGTRALNAALKERLNPGPGRFGGFDPGDRVAYSPAPGRILPGTVTGADQDGLRLDCGGSAVLVPRERVGSGALRHGWALTAHQAAGLRWPAAVVVLPGDAARGLTRSWVYTAFSRGERHLSVVQGVDQALPKAIAEVPVKERTTRLRTLLQLQSVQATADAAAAG
ncbi:helix-hairpin-helix domain-containing protein [Streptomyces sp. NPDC048644]|uniref:helix-hairpin-helix domain-containing protein n=1 Tax=Streptomyces sp. NPDC048644 TaxID=3365582 RepID=UPI003710F606